MFGMYSQNYPQMISGPGTFAKPGVKAGDGVKGGISDSTKTGG
jgi:hypothetical protein